jgi:hypothetical protein
MASIDSRTPADIFQTIAWVALTAVLFGYALVEGSLGALVMGAATLVLTSHAWIAPADRSERDAVRLAR